MRLIRILGVILATVSMTACLNSTTLVKVKPDGTGTVEQTTLMNMAALKGMMGGAAGQMNGPMMNKAELERTAKSMGEGVRLVSSEPVKGDYGFEGVKAIFAFVWCFLASLLPVWAMERASSRPNSGCAPS